MEQDDSKEVEVNNLQDWLDSLTIPSNENEKAHLDHTCQGLLSCYYCQIETSINSVLWEWKFDEK